MTLLGNNAIGGGKFACFLLPCVMENGITFVVSPLKAIMLEQVYYLKPLGVI
jgi:bloom syndrome protein